MNHHNHNIIYLVEGNFAHYNKMSTKGRFRKTPMKTLYSAIFCLNYFKGFSVIRTMNVMETVEYIIRMADKLRREKVLRGYYNGGEKENVAYCKVHKKEKKSNITPENIGSILLSQIPGVSTVTALTIMDKFESLNHLLEELKINSNCLNTLYNMTKTGKKRHISRTSINNIKKYLLYSDGEKTNVKI